MLVLKKIGLVMSVLLLGPTLLYLVSAYAFNQTIGDQQYTEKVVKQAKFYNEVSNFATEKASKANNDRFLNDALEETLSPAAIEKLVSPIINNSYLWLNGEKDQLDTTIDTAPLKQSFVNQYANRLKERADNLPLCAFGEIPNTTNIAEINCRPRGLDISQLIDQATEQAVQTTNIFSDQTTQDGALDKSDLQELGFTSPSKEATPEEIPRFYQLIKKSPAYAVIAGILSLAGIVLLSKTKLQGLRKISVISLLSGIVLFVVGWVIDFASAGFLPSAAPGSGEAPVKALQIATNTVFSDISSIFRLTGVIFAVTGLAFLITTTIILGRTKSKQKSD